MPPGIPFAERRAAEDGVGELFGNVANGVTGNRPNGNAGAFNTSFNGRAEPTIPTPPFPIAVDEAGESTLKSASKLDVGGGLDKPATTTTFAAVAVAEAAAAAVVVNVAVDVVAAAAVVVAVTSTQESV